MLKNALLLISLSALIGSTTPPFAKYALEGIGPFTLLFIRFASATLVLWFLLPKKERNLQVLSKLKLTGLFGAGNPLLFFVALTTIPASIVPLFFATNPSLTALHARLFNSIKISLKQIFGILIGFLGVGILTSNTFELNPDMKWWGILLLILAVLSFTAYAIRSDVHQKKDHISPASLVFSFSFVGAVVSLPFVVFEHIRNSAITEYFSLLHLLSGVFMGVVGTGLGYMLYQIAIKRSTALEVSIFFYIQPVFSVLIAVTLLGEKFTIPSIIGSAVILFGAQLSRAKKQKGIIPNE